MATETYWTIPAIGGKFGSEIEAFRFLGNTWGHIAEQLKDGFERCEKGLTDKSKLGWFYSLTVKDEWCVGDIFETTLGSKYEKRFARLFVDYIQNSSRINIENIEDYLCFERYFDYCILKDSSSKETEITPEKLWELLAEKNKGEFFVYSLRKYETDLTYRPAFLGMVPQSVYIEVDEESD